MSPANSCFGCNCDVRLVLGDKDNDIHKHLCPACREDSYKLGRAIKLSNLITAYELKVMRKITFMRAFYFASVEKQNSEWGAKCRAEIDAARIGALLVESDIERLRSEYNG